MRRVRWWVTASMTAVVVLSAGVSVVVLAFTGQRNAEGAADTIVERIGQRTADLVEGELVDSVRAIEQLAFLLADRSHHDHDEIEFLLTAQVVANRHLSGAYVGFPDGRFHFARRDGEDRLILKRVAVDGTARVVTERSGDADGRSFGHPVEIDDSYDPRVRPWYERAVTTDGAIWTDPYVFHSSGEPGVTAALAIHDDAGVVTAVVGVDLTVGHLARFLDVLPIDAAAEAFLVSGEHLIAAPSRYTVVRSSSDGKLTLAPVATVGVSPEDLAAGGRDNARAVGRDGGLVHVTGMRQGELPDWSVVVRTDRIDFVDAVRQQTTVALAATAAATMLLFTVVALVLLWLRRPMAELGARAELDPLTGLPNRRSVLEHAERVLARARVSGTDLTVALFDLDAFKAVNDQFGHAAGDRALERFAVGLHRAMRPDDIVGRFGGDEFAVILRGIDRVDATAILERLRHSAEEQLHSSPDTASCSMTIGATQLDGRDVDLNTLFREADTQLLASKRSGVRGSLAWAEPDPVSAPPSG